MISMQENETVGYYLPIIRAVYGEKKADKLIDACRNAESLSKIPEELFAMIEFAQKIEDGKADEKEVERAMQKIKKESFGERI